VENEQANSTSPESLASAMYAMSGTRSNSDFGSPKPSSAFPVIPKELYEAISEEVKVILQQQHACYTDKYGNKGGCSFCTSVG